VSRLKGRGPAALSVRGISTTFLAKGGELEVLSDVSFDIEKGELVCVLGPSGCGQSTLLKIVAGLESPDRGDVSVDGRTVSGPGLDRCVVFQEDALFPWLTVAENVAFGAKGRMAKSELRSEVNRHLEMTGLSRFADYLPREISGGMKQRVALARVLILKPKVLLMDEPFGALDAQTREAMQELLLSLIEDHSYTVMFITHDVGEAAAIADRVIVMDRSPGGIKAFLSTDGLDPTEVRSELRSIMKDR